jgi:hypothetical protein
VPCKSLAPGILFSTVFALVLLVLMQVGLSPTELKGGLAMIYATVSTLVAGFISSYVAGLALLPRIA